MEKELTREERFDPAIAGAVARWAGASMRWGRDDCLMALADIVLVATGRDVAKGYRGRYRSRRGALRVLGKGGVAGAVAKAARALAMRPAVAAACRTGGLGLVKTADGPAGVMRHGFLWIGRLDGGFSAYPSKAVYRAWD